MTPFGPRRAEPEPAPASRTNASLRAGRPDPRQAPGQPADGRRKSPGAAKPAGKPADKVPAAKAAEKPAAKAAAKPDAKAEPKPAEKKPAEGPRSTSCWWPTSTCCTEEFFRLREQGSIPRPASLRFRQRHLRAQRARRAGRRRALRRDPQAPAAHRTLVRIDQHARRPSRKRPSRASRSEGVRRRPGQRSRS